MQVQCCRSYYPWSTLTPPRNAGCRLAKRLLPVSSCHWVGQNTLGIRALGIYALCDKPSRVFPRSSKSTFLQKSAKICWKPVISCKLSHVRILECFIHLRSNEIPEMIAPVDSLNAGFCLTDPGDERYQYISKLKNTFGEFLHRASVALRDRWEENTDAVQMLVM